MLVCLLLVAWITPDEPEEVAELAHPGERIEQEQEQPTPLPVAAVEEIQVEPTVVAEVQEKEEEEEEEVLPCSCNKRVLRLPKNPYTAHQKAARNLPNSFFVKDKNELNAGKSRGKLVDVTDGRGYHIAPLSHSYAMLLPEVKSLLEDMGHAFADQLDGTKSEGTTFRVTSLTRTARQQARLGRRNYNAIDDGSTHSYGASFDIAFVDRMDDNASCSSPTREMERLLNRYQNAGIIYVIPEGGCMHITLRKP